MTKYTKAQRLAMMHHSVCYKAAYKAATHDKLMQYYLTCDSSGSTGGTAITDWYATAGSGGTIDIKYSTAISGSWDIGPGSWPEVIDRTRRLLVQDNRVKLVAGEPLDIVLPDGAVLKLDAQGNYVLEDATAKVHYKANRHREFNPFVNAGDLVARFIDYVGSLGVKREEVAGLPLKLFVNWLIVEAAEKDGDVIPEGVAPVIPLLRGQVLHPHCLACGRFVRRSQNLRGIAFCSGEHAAEYITRKAA